LDGSGGITTRAQQASVWSWYRCKEDMDRANTVKVWTLVQNSASHKWTCAAHNAGQWAVLARGCSHGERTRHGAPDRRTRLSDTRLNETLPSVFIETLKLPTVSSAPAAPMAVVASWHGDGGAEGGGRGTNADTTSGTSTNLPPVGTARVRMAFAP
jgi:hypothetical protein